MWAGSLQALVNTFLDHRLVKGLGKTHTFYKRVVSLSPFLSLSVPLLLSLFLALSLLPLSGGSKCLLVTIALNLFVHMLILGLSPVI